MRTARNARWLLLVVCLGVSATACGRPASSPPRLVLLYATCSLNKGFLSPYDPEVRFTPRFDAFARDALVFARHQTESGLSGPSYASLFSGTQATEHGIFRHPARLSNDVYLITEAYAEAGYETHSFLAHPMASANLGYAQGVLPKNARPGMLVAQSKAFTKVLDRLESDPDYRAFVVTNFIVTHAPYRGALLDEFCERYAEECGFIEAPEGRERFTDLKRLYRGSHVRLSFDFDWTIERLGLGESDVRDLREVTELLYKVDIFELDRHLGDLLDVLGTRGILDDTLFAVTSDHGEILYREDAYFRWIHGFQLAPEVLGVALLLRGPGAGVEPGRYEGVTRSIDVFPTLAGLSGIELPDSKRRGRDLSAAVRGEEPEPELLAYSHTSLFTDEVWQRYRHLHQVAELFPGGDDPEQIWTAVRRGDEFHTLRQLDGEWQHAVADLSIAPGTESLAFSPPTPDQTAVGDRLEAYKALLVESYETVGQRDRGVDSERTVELLRSIGYIE